MMSQNGCLPSGSVCVSRKQNLLSFEHNIDENKNSKDKFMSVMRHAT